MFQCCVLVLGFGGRPFSSWMADLGTMDLKTIQHVCIMSMGFCVTHKKKQGKTTHTLYTCMRSYVHYMLTVQYTTYTVYQILSCAYNVILNVHLYNDCI